ncbi:uncharacterized protein LOC141911008 isoform X2 [Tubulanus polymorphus]|uniref:uncharacterized protein LOC141911008 isoform X2 n=1 Tax=Tubulanus polymorphus TaxID=672921 RepID=UPI003DA6888B
MAARSCKTFLLVVLLLSGLLNVFGRSVHRSLRSRRSSRTDWSDDAAGRNNELQDALDALEREQRRKYEPTPPEGYASPLAYLFGNELADDRSLSDVDDDEPEPMRQQGDYDADYEATDTDLGSDFSDDDLISSLPIAEENLRERLGLDYDGFEPDEDDSDELKVDLKPADMRALAKLLASNGDNDNDIEEQKSKKDFDHPLSLQKPVSKRLKMSEVKTLLDDVEDISHDNVKGVEENKIQAGKDENGNDVMIKSTTVSKEEINNALSGDDDDDDDDDSSEDKDKSAGEKEETGDDDSSSSASNEEKAVTKEEIIEAFINENKDEAADNEKEISRKKRPVKRENREVSVAKEDIEKMLSLLDTYAVESKLIAKENEYLANALNSATLGQIEHTDAYLGTQYKFLEKAVDVEEALQNLKEDLSEDDVATAAVNEENDDDLEDAIDEEILNEALEKRTAYYNQQQSAASEADETDDNDDDENTGDDEEEIADNSILFNRKNDDNSEESTWYDNPIPSDFVIPEKGSPEYKRLNPFLREILEGYGPSYRKEAAVKRSGELMDDDDNMSDEIIESAAEEEDPIADDEETTSEPGRGDEDSEREIANTLEDLIDSMKPWQRRKLEGEINEIIDTLLEKMATP